MENSQNNEMRDNLILGGAIAGLGFGLYKIYQNWKAGGLSDIAPGNVAQRKAVMARLRESGEMTWTAPEKSKSGTPARPKKKRSSSSKVKGKITPKTSKSKALSKSETGTRAIVIGSGKPKVYSALTKTRQAKKTTVSKLNSVEKLLQDALKK